eukprot:augustus_masked-scaffold_53-processed-gene-1.26-mRNA-1 protein AED:0.12 eAED:0.12 QI:0/0/0/0.5/1/1/2/0/426
MNLFFLKFRPGTLRRNGSTTEDLDLIELKGKGKLDSDALKNIEIKKRNESFDKRKVEIGPQPKLDQAGLRMLMENKEFEENNNQLIQTLEDGILKLPGTTRTKIKLKWVREPKSVFVCKRPNDKKATEVAVKIAKYLTVKKINVIFESSAKKDLETSFTGSGKEPRFLESEDVKSQVIDLIICLGGDGTLLWSAGLFPKGVPPIVSFKLGSLGFLTPFPSASFRKTLENVLKNDVEATVRSRVEAQLTQCCKHMYISYILAEKKQVKIKKTCLNEVVAKHPTQMVRLNLYVNGNKITEVYADGIIIATPTGSTAYSAASGGSLVHPAIPAMVVTPIAPHTLSFRPIVLPDSSTLRLEVPKEARTHAFLTFDGRDMIEMKRGDHVDIKVSEYPLASYCETGEGTDWFQMIKESFLWNIRSEQKELKS